MKTRVAKILTAMVLGGGIIFGTPKGTSVNAEGLNLSAGIAKQMQGQIARAGVYENISIADSEAFYRAYAFEDVLAKNKLADKEREIKELKGKVSSLENEVETHKKTIKTKDAEIKKLKETVTIVKEEIETSKAANTAITFNPSNVTEISGATIEQLDTILKGTWLEGYGEVYYDMEQQYGINALFSIGNAILETGWGGDNYLATHKNNIYGLNMSKSFSSKSACINYWFKLIKNHYVGEGRLSIGDISTKYCPPNADKWKVYIPNIVNKLISNTDITVR